MHIPLQVKPSQSTGFTLIEISIVLVIIGLLVGGILTGRDLIKAAELSATISQITKYNTAVNTFRLKYGYLPGDIPDPTASQFGFIARGTIRGEGDGNGIIEGGWSGGFSGGDYYGGAELAGETVVFWVDLSTASLIDGGFNTATSTTGATLVTATTNPNLSQYFPSAKIGNGNYVYVWSGGLSSNGTTGTSNGINYFGLSGIVNDGGGYTGALNTSTLLTVQQAYNIDKKIDDGLPQSGNVTAFYDNYAVPYSGQIGWAAGGGNFGADDGTSQHGPTTAATPYAPTNCFDNNGVAGTQKYSLAQNAAAQNCALSFKFQ